MASTQQQRKDLEAQQAAYLLAEYDMTQAEIGLVLGGLSQSRVSRLLKRAEEKGWLRRRYEFIADGIQATQVDQLKRLIKPNSLIDRLAKIESRTGVLVRKVQVVENGTGGTSSRSWVARLRRFGRAAAEPLAELMSRSDVLALTWGMTLSSAIDHSRPQQWRATAGRAIRFVPVCGEPHQCASNRETSSHLATRLHALVKSTAPMPPSLTGVPALIGRRYHGADLRGIRRFVEDAASYREVFGGTNPLIGQVDSLLTAVGPADHPMGFIFEELLTAGSTGGRKLTAARLKKLVVGDIGGVLIPRPGLDAPARREVDELQKMWTGVQLDDLERIARAAAKSSRPGVIVAAIGGDDRAEIIAEVIRRGLVNELVIDRPLSEALGKALS
jgi:DNA-binding transcriptional regulator LsrR (DeoR family)